MRVILFQDRFAALVKAGTKTQTIRKTARCVPGDALSLRRWMGKPYRSKQEELGTAICTRVSAVWLTSYAVDINENFVDENAFARKDGFVDFGDMVLWFGMTHGLPFEGYLIEWETP